MKITVGKYIIINKNCLQLSKVHKWTSVAMSIQTRILLVDDESAIIENLVSFLGRSGFEINPQLMVKKPSQK
jgi:PleD family two-component response regulator